MHLFHNVPGYCSIFWEKEHKMTRILPKNVQGRPCRANSLWRILTILHKSRRPQVLFPLALVPQLVPFYGQSDQETCPVQWYLLSIVSKYSPVNIQGTWKRKDHVEQRFCLPVPWYPEVLLFLCDPRQELQDIVIIMHRPIWQNYCWVSLLSLTLTRNTADDPGINASSPITLSKVVKSSWPIQATSNMSVYLYIVSCP